MIYIDKSKHSAAGNQVTTDYLKDCCQDIATGRYTNVCYDKRDGAGERFCTTNHGIYRKRMVDVLLKNQTGYCCYCLRRLFRQPADDMERVTIEHIIPRGYNRSSHPQLNDYNKAPNLSSSEIILREEFEDAPLQTLPPFPHNVAYNNFVASCMGVFPDSNHASTPICCNRKRIEKYAYPVYFHTDIQQNIQYGDDGSINVVAQCPNKEETRQVITATKLFVRPLKEIRRLWYELRVCDYSLHYSYPERVIIHSPMATPWILGD